VQKTERRSRAFGSAIEPVFEDAGGVGISASYADTLAGSSHCRALRRSVVRLHQTDRVDVALPVAAGDDDQRPGRERHELVAGRGDSSTVTSNTAMSGIIESRVASTVRCDRDRRFPGDREGALMLGRLRLEEAG
jgi:hypothetical protein